LAAHSAGRARDPYAPVDRQPRLRRPAGGRHLPDQPGPGAAAGAAGLPARARQGRGRQQDAGAGAEPAGRAGLRRAGARAHRRADDPTHHGQRGTLPA